MNLIKCSAKAMHLCPDAKICCTQRHPAEFAEGSECHKFNEEVESLFTNADRVRSMTDEELAKWFLSFGTICEICSDVEIFCDDGTIACGRCAIGIENWLKQPYKEKKP